MKINCHANLDLLPADKMGWPKELPDLPRVGDTVENANNYGTKECPRRLRLKVVAVRWRVVEEPWEGWPAKWEPDVELHVPGPYETLSQFYEFYYGPMVGKPKSFFL